MSSIACQLLDVSEFRAVANRLASMMPSGPERVGMVNKFVESVGNVDRFTDMIVAYASRWLAETSGQSVLVGANIFWLLSSPESCTSDFVSDTGGLECCGAGARGRKMLTVCLMESLAQNQHLMADRAGDRRTTTNGVGDTHALSPV